MFKCFWTILSLGAPDPNNVNTEIWQCVDDTTIPEPVAKNQGNMTQDTVNE